MKINFSSVEIRNIADLYFNQKKTLKNVAEIYGVAVNTVKKVLLENYYEEYKIASKRNYNNLNIDHTFFQNIDTEEKAYIAGFLLADGNVYVDESYRIRIGLAYEDISILYRFKEILKLDSQVRVHKRKNRENSQPECVLCWSSKQHFEDLAKYGIHPNKTEDAFINFDAIPQKYHSHFIRGFFDGDGSISIRKDVSFTGSYFVISTLRNYLCNVLGIYPVKITPRTKKITVYQIVWCGKQDVQKIFDFLYKDSTIYLERKFKRF